MHELSVSSAIVDTALKHAAGRPVRVVSLRLGKLRQVVPESLTFYFEIVGRDTLCEGARLDVEYVDALMECVECGHTWDPTRQGPRFRCPGCGAAGAEVLQGEEMEIESIDVEDRMRTTA